MGMDINGISNVTPTTLTSNEPSNIENTETPVRINSINKKSNDEGVTYEKGDKTETGSYKINKMSKEDRAALVQQLKDNMEKQKQFITNAGHELKTPLAIISANTEVMEMIVRGNSVAKISELFVISENTVRTHSKHAYAKLGVHKRQDIIDMIEVME